MAAKKTSKIFTKKVSPASDQDKRESRWNRQFDLLKKFIAKNPGKLPKSREEFPKGNNLGLWLFHQRESFSRGTLLKLRSEQLKKAGVALVLPDRWEDQYENLLQFLKKFPERWPKVREEFPKGNNIGFWCHKQRQDKKRGKLTKDKLAKLNKIKFFWIPRPSGE